MDGRSAQWATAVPAFVARRCVDAKAAATQGLFQVRDDEPAPRLARRPTAIANASRSFRDNGRSSMARKRPGTVAASGGVAGSRGYSIMAQARSPEATRADADLASGTVQIRNW
jgi:hypothetical protein